MFKYLWLKFSDWGGSGLTVSRRDEIDYLSGRSRQFLETAEYQISKGFYGLAIFSLEQALQLFIKSKFLENGADYPRTHSVRVLLERLLELVDKDKRFYIKTVLDKYLFELGILEDAYITSRYILREFKKEEAERLLKVVREVIENVK